MTAQHTCWTTSLKMVFNVHVLTVLLCLSHALCLTESLQGNSHSNFAYKTTRISRPNSPLVIDYVQQANDSKARRGTYNATSYNWPNDIPYVIDPSFTGDRVTLGQVMTYISSRVCVTFHNVTDTFDERDPNWLHDHGYQTRAHLIIRESNGCFSEHGQGGGVGSRYSSPCHEFGINLHELLHTLGVIHSHQEPMRDNYITVHTVDIKPELKYSYGKVKDPALVSEYFDGTSAMMYGDTTWNSDGMETFTPIRDDLFQTSLHFSEENVVFYELSRIYKCNEKFCHNATTDCSPGYHTLYHGKCQCVCPDHLDHETNCKSQINGPSTSLQWPKTPMVLYGNERCPRGFEPVPGRLSVNVTYGPRQEPVPELYSVNGHVMTLLFCSKTGPENPGDMDWSTWPVGGGFCFVRPVGVECGGIFKDGGIQFLTKSLPVSSGVLGDIQINGPEVTMNFCCKDKEHYGTTIDLPNADPFRLIDKSYAGCPTVRGMRSTRSVFTLWSDKSHKFGPAPPMSYFYSNSFLHYQCYYQPPVYGCNNVVNLTLTNRSVTITTPGFTGHREPNRRCLYDFNVPEDAKLRLTLNKYDLHKNDEFLVKRVHQWQDPYKIPTTDWPYQLVSEGSYLSLEYWASWEVTDKNGVNFTVELLPDSEMCYNVEMKGADYSGNKSVGETYDDCVPWTEAATCEDFPFDGVAGVSLLLSEDKCRNPGGALLQPWCYTYVRDHRCHKRYCDVCNLYTAVDVIKDCAALQASNPDLCTSGIERYGCSKFCGLSLETYQRAHCPVPDLPSDTVVVGENRSTYYQGESIKISCRSSGDVLHELTCSKDGWSGLPFTCNGCPLGWTEHGDRCYKYIATSATRREAEKICRSYDPTGTLFEIRSLEDQTAIRTMRNSSKDYQTGNWVSGELRSEYGLWLFDTGDPMVYFNWSTAAETTSLSYNCVELIAETQAHNEQGGWRTTSCDGTNMAPFICQVDNLKSAGCNDRIRTCPEAMAKFPDFCLHSGFQKTAYENCRRSCGLCRDKSFAQCFDPNNGTTYVRTSSASAVNVGYVMSFACKPGFYQTGGDLRRVCSSDGHLLGAEPVCETTPRAVDLKADKIRRRKETLAKNIAILLDHEGYRIPFDGKLTSWYYYCNTEGQLDFFVMRKTGSTYQYIGSNSLRCQPNWVMSYRVPTAEQISVLKSDVFGAFSINATLLSITDCDSASVKMLQLPAMNVTSLHDLQDSSRPLFSGQKCAVPSLGVRVEP